MKKVTKEKHELENSTLYKNFHRTKVTKIFMGAKIFSDIFLSDKVYIYIPYIYNKVR